MEKTECVIKCVIKRINFINLIVSVCYHSSAMHNIVYNMIFSFHPNMIFSFHPNLSCNGEYQSWSLIKKDPIFGGMFSSVLPESDWWPLMTSYGSNTSILSIYKSQGVKVSTHCQHILWMPKCYIYIFTNMINSDIKGLAQDCSNSIALAMELL